MNAKARIATNITDPFALKIMEHKYLPAGTILVSSDIAALLREKYSEDGIDRAFLRHLGISDEGEKK